VVNWSAPAARTTTATAAGAARASDGHRISSAASATPSEKAAKPNAVHTSKYARPTSKVNGARRVAPVRARASRYRHSIGVRDGSIIAAIITTHIPRNDAARSSHVCPHIRVHASDIVQPPGIGMRPMDDMAALHTTVAAALAVKSSAAAPKKAHREARSEMLRRDISRLPCVATISTAPA
jgi:hypothetical protein